MSQINFSRTLLMFGLVFTLAGCSQGYQGPIADKPVTNEGDRDADSPEATTLFDKVLKNGVPEVPLRKAFDYFDAHRNSIKNQNYMTIIDFSQHSGGKRFYLIDLKTGAVDKLLTAHGKGSDVDHDGNATVFSNTPNSNMTSLGFMITAERYIGEHGVSLRLDGLQTINSNVRVRAIVIHGADYVDPTRPIMGRSLGCPAVENRLIVSLVKKIENGSLLYSYYSGL